MEYSQVNYKIQCNEDTEEIRNKRNNTALYLQWLHKGFLFIQRT